jgi:hypothetical protein
MMGPFGWRKHAWEDNIKMYVEEFVREVLDWIQHTQDRVHCLDVVSVVMNHGKFPKQLSGSHFRRLFSYRKSL